MLANISEKTYTLETKEISAGWNDSGYRFRIVCSDGRFSGWAPYDRVVFLDDTAALTPYYLGESDARMMPLAEAMTHVAIGEHVEQSPQEKGECDGTESEPESEYVEVDDESFGEADRVRKLLNMKPTTVIAFAHTHGFNTHRLSHKQIIQLIVDEMSPDPLDEFILLGNITAPTLPQYLSNQIRPADCRRVMQTLNCEVSRDGKKLTSRMMFEGALQQHDEQTLKTTMSDLQISCDWEGWDKIAN